METTIKKLFKTISYAPWQPQLVNNDYLFEYTLNNFESNYKCKTLWLDFKDRCDISFDEFNTLYHNFLGHTKRYNKMKLDFSKYDTYWCDMDKLNQELEFGKVYLSIDMIHSYSQLMDRLGVLEKPFDELINDYIGNPILHDNKKLRLCFYHELKFHEDTKYFVSSLFEDVLNTDCPLVKLLNDMTIYQINVDELVYDITECVDNFKEFVGSHCLNGVNVNVNIFTPHLIKYYDEFGKECTYHIREYATHTEYIEKECRYINQIYKVYNGLPINDLDLYVSDINNTEMFYKLKEPIKIISIQ